MQLSTINSLQAKLVKMSWGYRPYLKALTTAKLRFWQGTRKVYRIHTQTLRATRLGKLWHGCQFQTQLGLVPCK